MSEHVRRGVRWRDQNTVVEAFALSARCKKSFRFSRGTGDAMSPREWKIGGFPSSIAKSRLATPFRDVLDGLPFFGGRAIVPRNKRGAPASPGASGYPSMTSPGPGSRNSEHLMRAAVRWGPSIPLPAGFRPAFSLRPVVAVVFGAHCTISYENGSANYSPRRRAPRSFSRCKCALRGFRCPRRGNRGAVQARCARVRGGARALVGCISISLFKK